MQLLSVTFCFCNPTPVFEQITYKVQLAMEDENDEPDETN